MAIFRDNASLYWDAGIPVIPLKRWNSPGKGAGKAPILNEWTQYGQHMPSEAMRSLWLSSYPDSNIGLPFGPASGLCAIDIDTENEEYINAIRGALPDSPWVRVGRKGMGLIFRWNGQPNFKLRDEHNESLVEFLGLGNQMVLPPSIHPDTEKPYTSDTNLWEVLDKIRPLPAGNLEQIIRDALGLTGLVLAQTGRSGPLDVVPQGERDIQMVRRAGYYARVVEGIDKQAKFSLAEAMNHIREWTENYTASSSGDDMDPEKAVAKLVEFLLKDVEAGKTLPSGWDEGLTDEQKAHPAIAAMIEKNAVQRWTYSKARDWIQAKAEILKGDDDAMLDAINELLAAIAADDNFKQTDFNTLVGVIQRASGEMRMTKATLNQAYKEAKRGDEELAEDHEAIARQMIEEINRDGQLVHSLGRFWQWNGAHFESMDRKDIYNIVAARVKGNSLARRHNDYESIVKTIENLVAAELVKSTEVGINFANGFLDNGLVLHEHSPKYGKTFTLPFNYIPERATEAHKWLAFLESSWGDDEDYAEKVMALQEAFAATMFGVATTYQRAFLLHGRGKTGKTQALEVLQAMMPPDSRCSIPPALWGERFQLAAMVGKTLNVCGELPEETTISGEKFKGVTVGEVQNTEFKGKDSFDFRPIAAHWFASNHLPRTRDTTEAFTRRWLIFDFNKIVSNEDRIVDFWKVLIAEEREAIAAWAVQGLKRLEANNEYTLPKSHILRQNQVARANNSVVAFLQSSDKVRVTNDPADTVDVRNVFDHYVYYMKEISRGWSVTYERFKQMLDDAGHSTKPYFDGVGVQRDEAVGIKLLRPMLPEKTYA